MNVLIFEDKADATLMTRYTGKELHHRHAILSLNMAGGGGFEIWQYVSRSPTEAVVLPQLGDLGIFAIKIKARNVNSAHQYFREVPDLSVSDLQVAPDDRPHFWVKDALGNHFEIVEGDEWFTPKKGLCGGVVGAVIGVSDMKNALCFYKTMLGIDEVVYSGTAPMVDVPRGAESGNQFHRILLKKQVANKGAFSKFLGSVQIELVEIKNKIPDRIYGGRFWGDCGFIHLCFDVLQMDAFKALAAKSGHPFTVDSADAFPMGSCAGRFCYMEDPDKTLIELVETYKVPIFKKLGLYLNLKNRSGDKRLPDWVIGLLALNKIR